MTPPVHTRVRPVTGVAALAWLILLACALAPAAAPASGVETVPAPTAGDPERYWTEARMRAAEPLDPPAPPGSPLPPGAVPLGAPPAADGPSAVGATAPGSAAVQTLESELLGAAERRRAPPVDRSEVADPSAAPFRAHGKVFLAVSGGSAPGNYVCSGTALSSNNRSVVWTAGHCVFDDLGGGFANNLIFVPGYRDGNAPYGEWTATELGTTEEWRREANLSFDLGAAVVARDSEGRGLVDVVGGRGVGFNQPRRQQYASFGYPAQQPPLEFTGGRMFRCDSPLGGTDNPPGSGPATNWIACDMNGGSSGGGWVAEGAVLSVNSYSYCLELICEQRLYGPYQSDAAQDLYKAVAGKPELCAGKKVTILGTGGDDVLAGTQGADVFKAAGGDDTLKGRGGRDLLCGGDGADTIKGGAGGDKLKGQSGSDVLSAGGGRDACNGGPGGDRARSCEKASRI